MSGQKKVPNDKPKLDRAVLESHGVTFSEKVYRPESLGTLPEHVESIRKALLRLEAFLPESHRKFFEEEARMHSTVVDSEANNDCVIRPPDLAYRNQNSIGTARYDLRRYQTKRSSQAENEIEQNETVAFEAREHVANKASEPAWSKFMSTYIFKEFHDVHPEATEEAYLFDQWALETDAHWNEVHKYANYDQSITRPTNPKPDFTYAFPIHKSLSHLAQGFRDDDSVANFSLEVLGSLYEQGLVSAPLTGLSNWVGDNSFEINRSHLMCFPWAVVELKHSMVPKSEIDFAYCQAANATSAALRLFEELLRHAGGTAERIPPVVAFTCIGPFIRAWLAYSSTPRESPRCHRMVCIWSGTLTTTWGVIATHRIVKNMFLWAFRVLRPTLSGYLSQITLKQRLSRSDLSLRPEKMGGTKTYGQSYQSTQTPSMMARKWPAEGHSAASGSTVPRFEWNADNYVDNSIPTRATQSIQHPSSTQGAVLPQESILSDEPKKFSWSCFSQENALNWESEMARKTDIFQSHTPLASKLAPTKHRPVRKYNSPPLQPGNRDETSPAPKMATARDYSVPQISTPDSAGGSFGEDTSEASSSDPPRTSAISPRRRILTPKSQRSRTPRSDSSPISFPRYNVGIGIFGQTTPTKTSHGIKKTTPPGKQSIVTFPKVEKSASQEREVRHDAQEKFTQLGDDLKRIPEPDGAHSCSVETDSEESDLYAAADIISEHDPNATLLGEAADLQTEFRNEVDGLQNGLSAMELDPVSEPEDPKDSRCTSGVNPCHHTQVFTYHDYRFLDTPDWIFADAINPNNWGESEPLPKINSNENEAGLSDEPSESGDCEPSNTGSDSSDNSDEPSESGDYEPSNTGSDSSDSSDGSDSFDGETAQIAGCVLDGHGSVLSESDTNRFFLNAAEALWGPDFVKLGTIRNIVYQLSGDQLLHIIRFSLDLILSKVPKTKLEARKEVIRLLNEAIGLESASRVTLADLSSAKRLQILDKSLKKIARANKELLRAPCLAALACWDSPGVFRILWDHSRPPSKDECLSIGREALELIYSLPVECALTKQELDTGTGAKAD